MPDNLIIKSIVTDNRITAQFSDKYLPRYARLGELFVVDGILYIYANLDDSGHGRWFPLTDRKEIYTFEQETPINRWVIPIDFHTDNIQIIVYDDEDKIFREDFTVNIDNMQVEVIFEEPTAGQVYIIINKAFDWVDERFIVADKKFAITHDEIDPQKYFIEVDTEYFEILKNGNTTFRQNVIVEGELNVEGTATFNGDQQINGNMSVSQDLNIGGTIKVVNDLIANLNTHIKANLQVDGNTVIDGDLTVKGTTTSIQTEEIKLDDNLITLNSNAVGVPTQNAGIEVERGESGKSIIIQWDESNDETNIPNNTTINGNLQIDGNTNIDGNLTIKGDNVDIATTSLTVEDNIITINKGFTGIPVDNVGLEIDRGDSGILSLLTFDETNDYVSIPVKQQDGTFLQDEIAGKVYTLGEINKEKSRAINEETVLTDRISNLENTVTIGDNNLQTQLNSEISNRENADNNLQSNLNDEILRASSTENTLRSDLLTEINERETTDTNLQTQISSESSARINSDAVIQASINTEKSRAETVEANLQTQLNIEITRATNTEGNLLNLSTTDKTNLVSAINEEISRAVSSENDINNNLSLETNNRINADNILQNNIDSEITNRTNSDNILQTNINSEETARIDADNTLQLNITTETQRATTAEAVIYTKFGDYVSSIEIEPQEINSDLTVNENVVIKKNLTVEGETTFVNTTSSEIEDNKVVLNSNITTGDPTLDAFVTVNRGDEGEHTIIKWYENGNSSEVQISEWDTDTLQFVERRIASKIYVDNELNSINTSLDGRITLLENDTTVSTLSTNLSNEIIRAAAVEGDLTQLDTTLKTNLVDAINSEIMRANSIENTITSNLTSEINRSVSKDNELESELDNEVLRSVSKDNELETNLTSEINRAITAEGDITSLTTSNKTNLVGAINSLKTVVDTNNSTQISTLSDMFTKIDDDIIFKGNLIPETDSTLNIGSVSNKIGELYVSANTIYLGDNTIINELGLQLVGSLNASTLNATNVTADNIYDKTTVDTILTGVETELTTAITTLELAHNALVETVSTNSISKTVTEPQSVVSDMSFMGDITIQGSLNIIGNQTSNEVVNLFVENNEIVLNNGIGEIEPYLDAIVSVDRGNEGIQPILRWKELGLNSAVMVPYIDGDGNIIEDEIVTANTLNAAISLTNNNLTSVINDEITRAITTENNLENDILTEVNRAKTVEGVLDSLSVKLQDAEGNLPSNLVAAINKEVSRAYLVESGLTTNLNNEINRTTLLFESQTLALETENLRAINRENAIETALNTEKTRAQTAEAIITNSVTTEKTRAQAKENALVLDLNNEITRSTSAEASLQSQIDTIVSTMSTDAERLAAIQSLTEAFEIDGGTLGDSITELNNTATINLNNEITRATTAENIIATNLNNEITRAKDVEGQLISLNTVSQNNLVSAINEVHFDIDNENIRAVSAENVLTTNLSNEIVRASNAENLLTTNLNNEVTRATTSETTLQSNIDAEEAARIASDTTLQTNINTETTRAETAENLLTTNLNNEVTRATTSETTLQSNIDAEEAERIASDTTLQTNIDTEKARIDAILLASTADTDSFAEIVTLINSIDTTSDSAFASYVTSNDTRSTTIETNLNTEITRATLAETSLQISINNLQTALDGKQIAGVYNTNIGTNVDLNTLGATVVNSINVTDGVIISMDSRTLTLADLGYLGDTNANNYIHPTDNGNKHIPSDGVAGKILRWNSAGTAEWGDNINTWRDISDSISTTSSTVSASLTAVKTAYDLANHTHPYAPVTGDSLVNFNVKSLIASESVKTPIFYDSDNLAYYADFSNTGTSINCAGAIIASGDVVAYSDRRLKDNIEIIPNALNKVLSLNGVTFTRKDLNDPEKRHTGVIAQEVENVLPEAVNTDIDGMKSVAYGNMVGVLIEAIKEQQGQIDELKKEIKLLKGE